MMTIRKRTAWIAAAWLLCHTLALTAPLAAAAIAAAADLCTCPGGTPGAVCPMHHHAMSPEKAPDGPRLRNGCAQPDVTLLSLFSGPGVLPETTLPGIDTRQTTLEPLAVVSLQRARVPDAPPPRA